jgi:hypothetical protein
MSGYFGRVDLPYTSPGSASMLAKGIFPGRQVLALVQGLDWVI